MFGWLRQRSTDNWTETGVTSAKGLSDLASSNPVVAAELKEFLQSVQDDKISPQAAAEHSARALSGYGIDVAAVAFLAYLEDIRLGAR